MGVRNVRLLAGAEEGPLRASVTPGFVNRAGQLNQALLTGLDHAMAELARRDMTAVLYLTNNWEWSGGMMTRLWYDTGHYLDNNDPAHPWPAFPDAAAEFYANNNAVTGFFGYVRMLVGRVNAVTGRAYRDDPAILSWQLCNEPRPGVSSEVMARVLPGYCAWIDASAALIRSIDPNHMVSLGMEGTIASAGREDIVLRAHQSIDYLTAHVWPLNWGWVDGRNLAGTWDAGRVKVEDYLATHIRLAKQANKPLVIEEFGFPRDGELYDPAVPTTFRERYYRLIYAAAEASLAGGGPIVGTNFWGWNGEARTNRPDHRWYAGDPLMGDPPHEPQGWYGNFDSDMRMIALIREHAGRFATQA
jgi:mannan endo-1,4-beta-mannosidase